MIPLLALHATQGKPRADYHLHGKFTALYTLDSVHQLRSWQAQHEAQLARCGMPRLPKQGPCLHGCLLPPPCAMGGLPAGHAVVGL